MPKVQFDKDLILEKSLAIAIEEGFEGISVRKLAKAVGCSTAPIYTAFDNIDNLIDTTKNKVVEILKEYVKKKYTRNNFLNIGVGILVFAKDYPSLYREMFIKNTDKKREKELREVYLSMMKKNVVAKYMNNIELETLLTKIWLFTHGIATMICSGAINISDENDFIKMLGDVGRDIILAMLYKNGNLQNFVKEHSKEEYYCENYYFRWNFW